MVKRRSSVKHWAGFVAGLVIYAAYAVEPPGDDVKVECTKSYISVRAIQVPAQRVLRELADRCAVTVRLGVPLDEPQTVEIEKLQPQRAARRLLSDYSFVLRYARPSPDAGNWLWVFADGPEQVANEEVIRPAVASFNVDKREAIYLLADDAGDISIGYLSNALVDPDRDIREAAVETLAEIGTDNAAEMLEVALHDPDSKISESALDALGQIGGPIAMRLLHGMLDTPDPLLREAAADNLKELNGML